MIQEEIYQRKPRRDREKAMGFMWDGEMEVIAKDGLRFVFDIWHHFHEDDGESWYPSQEQLDQAWAAKFVPKTRGDSKNLCDAYWHTIYEGNHIYISQQGWFGSRDSDEHKGRLVASIKDGSWVNNSDLWMLL